MITTDLPSKVINKQVNLSITQMIFSWDSTYEWANDYPSPHSHCLLRIYWLRNESKAVVIASSLFSNEDNTDVYSGYYDLAIKLIKEFPRLKSIVSSITWLAHSGQFSCPLTWAESHQKDRFTQMKLEFDESCQTCQLIDTQDIFSQDVIKMLDGAYLEPAIEILRQLEHDNNWGGIVDERQVALCHELAAGIILGQKRTAGSVGW